MGATPPGDAAFPNDTPQSIQVPRSTERWIVVGVCISSIVLITISLSSGVTLSQLEGPGYLFVALAVLAVLSKLMVQVLKFRVIAGGLTRGLQTDFSGVTTARVGSEFVALTTPSFIGGEFVRAAWLTRKGVEAGRALWIGFVEICIDVYVGSAVSLVAAWVAFLRGATTVAELIVIVVVPIMAGYAFFILLFAKKGVRFPTILHRLIAGLLGERRAEYIVTRVQGWADEFSAAAKATGRQSVPTILLAVGLALVQAIISGLILWLLLAPGGTIDLISSVLAVFGVQALASVPVTVGGSGISELGLQWYLSSVYGFSSWATVVLWRLVSYQLVEVLTGGAFIVLLTRGMRRNRSSQRGMTG